MDDGKRETLRVGDGPETRDIAVRVTEAGNAAAGPGLFWLGGFRSDMTGSKATALDGFARAEGRSCVRFDYSGHGASSGAFSDGTISRWLDEADAVFQRFASDPTVAVGSSMGGWIALLLARRLLRRGERGRLAGLVLVAPAWDMTRRLIADDFSDADWAAMDAAGRVLRPSDYGPEPDEITRALVEDGDRHLFGEGPIETGCPVHVIQGMEDTDVPFGHAVALMERLVQDEAVLTLVRDGDHRLSRPEDIERMLAAVRGVCPPASEG